MSTNDPFENYRLIIDTFIKVVERHAPLKNRFVRGDRAPFTNKGLRKATYTRSRLGNNICWKPTKENKKKYEIQQNIWVSSYEKKVLRNILRIFLFNSVNKTFLKHKRGYYYYVNEEDKLILKKSQIVECWLNVQLILHKYCRKDIWKKTKSFCLWQ